MASHFTIHQQAIPSHKHHLIHLTFHPCHTLLVLSPFTSSHMHISLYIRIISSHINISFPISYFQYLNVCFIFISLADDGCNTPIESFQTDRLLRVFHSCHFHYSEELLCYCDTGQNCKYVYFFGYSFRFKLSLIYSVRRTPSLIIHLLLTPSLT